MDTIPTQTEIWLPVIGYEGRYEVSNTGLVRSRKKSSWKILKPNVLKRGYSIVRLFNGSRKTAKDILVHILVAASFLGEKPNGMQVNHIDGNKSNNHINNLEYLTGKENMQHAVKLGLFPSRKGEAHPSVKLKALQVQEIRALHGTRPITEIAKDFGITRMTASAIIHRRLWKHL
jgi:hypothetical protein